jgi:acyl-CoA thioesterase FadM
MGTAAYLEFFVAHRVGETCRVLGIDPSAFAEMPTQVVVKRAEVIYRRSLQLGEAFEIRSRVTAWGERSCIANCEMSTLDGVCAATCTFEFVCVVRGKAETSPWPADIVDALHKD